MHVGQEPWVFAVFRKKFVILSLVMTKKTSDFVRGRVLECYQFLKSYRKASGHLLEEGIKISHQTVKNIVRADQRKNLRKPIKKKTRKNPGTPLIRTKRFVIKVAKAINCANPPRQRDLAGEFGVSQSTIALTTRKDLGMKYKSKTKTHKLTDKQGAQRLARGPRFRRWLSQRKLPYIVTIDETWVSTNNTTGCTDGYYESKEKPAPDEFKMKEQSGWPTKILCAMGICSRGKTSLMVVPENAKVNNEVFLKEVLIPIWRKDIPRLYPGEEHKVILHMDAAPAHFHPNVVSWLRKNKITYIPKEDWPANSPDLSPMDYGINGIFKNLCKRRRASTRNELVMVATAVWEEIEIPKIQRVISSWPFRVDSMIKAQGFQIEHFSE